jgi:predicted lipid-binding transport protein (Tim44 family)
MPSDTPTSVRVLRNIDVPVLALALVIFLVSGLPIVGWVTGAGAWAIQRLISEYATRKANRAEDPRATVGILAGSMIGRGWLVAGIIIAVGLGNNTAGLSAAVLFLAVFTIQFTITLAMRPFETKGPRTP